MNGSERQNLIMNSRKHKAYAAAAAANIIFGLSFMATTIALESTTPDILLAARFTASVIFMLIIMLSGAGSFSIRGKAIGQLLLFGLLQPVIYFIAETYGIKYTTSSFSGVMIAVIPLVSSSLSAFFLKEKLPLRWILCSITGVIIISVSQGSEGVIELRGFVYLVIAVLAASFCTLLNRKLSGEFTAFERTFIMMLMGAVAFNIIAITKSGADFIPMAAAAVTDIKVLLPVLFLSLVSSVIAFFCTNYSFSYLEVSKATAFGNLTPVVSVAAGVLILGEPFSPLYLLAIILILLGVYKTGSSDEDKAE